MLDGPATVSERALPASSMVGALLVRTGPVVGNEERPKETPDGRPDGGRQSARITSMARPHGRDGGTETERTNTMRTRISSLFLVAALTALAIAANVVPVAAGSRLP